MLSSFRFRGEDVLLLLTLTLTLPEPLTISIGEFKLEFKLDSEFELEFELNWNWKGFSKDSLKTIAVVHLIWLNQQNLIGFQSRVTLRILM